MDTIKRELVLTAEQYQKLSTKNRLKLEEYEVKFYDLDHNGFWGYCLLTLYAEGKAAHSEIEKWIKAKYPIAEQIRVTYQ